MPKSIAEAPLVYEQMLASSQKARLQYESLHPCSQSSCPPLKGRLRQMKPLMRSVFVQITTVMVPEIPTDRKTDKNWLFVLRFKVKLTDELTNIHRSLFHPSSFAVYS